jgi:ion channel-forming bestrophin family protein
MSSQGPRGFWREAIALRGSITLHVLPHVLAFGAIAAAISVVAGVLEGRYRIRIGMAVAPYELAGATLGLLLVLRTNAGYDRWWEARKLWGGIVNQTRNLAITALAYGPGEPAWRERLVRWAAAFPHVARRSLRGQRELPEVAALVGAPGASAIAAADHMPSAVAARLAGLLREAADGPGLSPFAFLQADRERALLIDHIGACERILKTPLPGVYAIKIRRFIVLFLVTLPFALVHKLDTPWLIPLVTMLVAYPLVSLDQIGVELQNPFSTDNLSHLPLDELSRTIERNLLGLLAARPVPWEEPGRPDAGREPGGVLVSEGI